VNPYLGSGQAEHIGQHVPQHERSLVAGPDLDAAVGRETANGAVRLDSAVIAQGELKMFLESYIALLEAFLRVPIAQGIVVEDVCSFDRVNHVLYTTVLPVFFVDQGSSGAGCFDGIQNKGQGVVLDLELLEGGFGLQRRLRQHNRHCLPRVPNLIHRNRGLIPQAGAEEDFAVLSGYYLHHPGHIFSFTCIDRSDPGMRRSGSLHLGVKHAGQPDIGNIGRRSRYLGFRIHPWKRFADIFELHTFPPSTIV